MTKLTATLTASALALSLSAVAFADDETPLDPYPTTQEKTGTAKTQNQGGTSDQQSKQKEEYLSALKRCQEMQDVAMQQKCTEQTKQKYDRM